MQRISSPDDPAGLLLADEIAKHIRAARLAPGAIVASEQALRARHEAGRSVLRQAVRILEERGVAYMRRGQGGGLVVAQPSADFASRGLAIAIESRMQGASGLDLLLKAADTYVFLAGAPKLDVAACNRLRRLVNRLGALSAREFKQARGHHQLIGALRGLFKDPLATLAYGTGAEYGIDLLPDMVSTAEAGNRGELWRLSTQMVDAVIANDIAALFDLRRRQQEMVQRAWPNWGDSDRERRVVPAIDSGAAEQAPGTRAERLAREILRDVRLMGWKAGERIGGAADLMTRYQATVSTLREAVRMLEEHSAVRMERGRNGGLFIATPDVDAAKQRALAYLAQAGMERSGAQAFLTELMLDVLALLAGQTQPKAALRAAFAPALERPGPAADKLVYRALARLCGNAALELFTDIVTALLASRGRAGAEEYLGLIVQALAAGDAPRARRAFLSYARSGALLG